MNRTEKYLTGRVTGKVVFYRHGKTYAQSLTCKELHEKTCRILTQIHLDVRPKLIASRKADEVFDAIGQTGRLEKDRTFTGARYDRTPYNIGKIDSTNLAGENEPVWGMAEGLAKREELYQKYQKQLRMEAVNAAGENISEK